MKSAKLFILFLFFSILISACSQNKESGIDKKTEDSEANQCYIKIQKQITGNSMEPMLRQDETVALFQNYYDCHEVQKGDLVAYDYGGKEIPIIKKVVAIGKDSLSFAENKLIINDEILKNSVGQEYLFSEAEQKMISLYIVDGKLTENGYLIFGDNVNNSLDSRKFGAVGKADFLGKFEMVGE